MTFVLIHGGGSSGRYWDRVVPLLAEPSLAVDMPGRAGKPADLATLTVDEEVASIVADVEAAGGDDCLIVVAHSSGGLVVPGVVAGLGGRVAHVILNAALVPTEGSCGIDCMKPRHRDGLRMAMEMAKESGTPITLPGPPDDPEPLRTSYGGDPLSDADLAFVADPTRSVPDTVFHYFQPVRWSLAGGVPVTYILNEQDRPVLPEAQEEMAPRVPNLVALERLACGHLPAVTMPDVFAGLLNQVASAAT